MADWLRPVFTRVKTPVPDSPSNFDKSNASHDDLWDLEEKAAGKLRTTSRVSSFLISRPNTPPVMTADDFQGIKHAENVYHRPSGDQMAETLKVIMMNSSLIDPLPIEYNACILHVLETYQNLRLEVNASQNIIDELKESHTKDIKEFEELAINWEKKEQDYKTEIRKLEVLLAKTEGGMETVSMARSRSLVHGSQRAAESIGRSLSNIKQRHESRSSRGSSNRYSSGNASCLEQPQPQRYSETPKTIRARLADMDRAQKERQKAFIFDSSTSSAESSSISAGEEPAMRKSKSLGLRVCEKPLPEIPTIKTGNGSQERAELKYTDPSISSPGAQYQREMCFSFNPGDDNEMLMKGEAKEIQKRQVLEEHIRHRRSTAPGRPATTIPRTEKPKEKSKKEAQGSISQTETKSRSSSVPNPVPPPSPHSREDSNSSSVITAIRDSSGRSSVAGSRTTSRAGRPHPNFSTGHSPGSSDAIAAASKAFQAKMGEGIKK
ncbi:hypothetical protein BGZ60DRAFT_434341 [Tricladium varicosporioides]|nr:hypothetical protein BGZ60DRAFT_434341 [Hymenoscyphus varicosporioides]